jgi:hypothetical protein
MNKACIDDLFEKYKLGEPNAKLLFPAYVSGLRPDSYRVQEFCNEVFEREGRTVEIYEPEDRGVIRKNQKRLYFACLLNKESYSDLIEDLIRFTDAEIKIQDLIDLEREVLKDREDLLMLKWDLYHWDKNIQLGAFMDCLDWDWYSINRIQRHIKNDSEILITDKHKMHIKEYCLTTIKEHEVSKGISFDSDGFVMITNVICIIAYFGNLLDIKYEIDEMLSMLMVPTHLFEEKSGDYDKFPDYLIRNLEKSAVENRVRQNLQDYTLKGDVARAHYNYCKEHKMRDALDVSLKFCENKSNNVFDKRIALEYIESIKGSDFVIEHFVETDDVELFNLIVQIYSSQRNRKLEDRLIRENEDSEDGRKFLGDLISMNSKVGLSKFVKLTRTMKHVPGLDKNSYPNILDSFNSVNDIELLPYIGELVEIRFSDSFEDKGFFTMYNMLNKVLKRLAEQDFQSVFEYVEAKLEEHKDNLDMRCFLNYVKEDIEMLYYEGKRSVWDIPKLKAYLDL